MKHRTLVRLCLLLGGALGCTPSALAQAVNTNVIGNVTDATRANVPNAEVTFTEQATGISATRTANNSGNFEFPNMPPENYTGSAEHAGVSDSKEHEHLSRREYIDPPRSNVDNPTTSLTSSDFGSITKAG